MPELRRDPVVGRWVIIDSDHYQGAFGFSQRGQYPHPAGDLPVLSRT